MKVGLFYNQSEKSQKVADEFLNLCCNKEFERDDDNPDVVITIGGDGTLLGAVHHYKSQLDHIRFAAIHTGHLGFYTDWRDFQAGELIESLKHDQGESVSYPLLDVTLEKTDGTIDYHIALNEATLRKVNGTLVCEVLINGELFENFRGDGVCVATPTGSTAYSLSAGGPIITPELKLFLITPIAPHNLNTRPIILSGDVKLVLTLSEPSQLALINIDGHTHKTIKLEEKVEIFYSKESLKIVIPESRNYYDVLREKLKWGENLC